MTKSHIYGAAATIVGTLVGAGILGIPYMISKTGIMIGLIQIIGVGLLFMLLNLYMGEIALRTKGTHQMTGYAEKYLGKKGKIIITASMILGIWIAITAYGIGLGEVISEIFGGDKLTYSLIMFAILSTILYFGINLLENMEKILVTTVIIILGLIFLQSASFIHLENLTKISTATTLSSFGVIFFAYLGSVSIIEAKEMLGKKRKLLKKAIIIGMTIPIIIYSLFAFFVVGVTGEKTTEVATIGLGEMTSVYIIVIGNILAMLTMSTAFLGLGFALKEMFQFDYDINKDKALICTIAIPLIIVVLGFTDFIKSLSIAGALEGGILSTAIVLMILKAKKQSERKPEYTVPINRAAAFLIIVFFIGIMLYNIAKATGML